MFRWITDQRLWIAIAACSSILLGRTLFFDGFGILKGEPPKPAREVTNASAEIPVLSSEMKLPRHSEIDRAARAGVAGAVVGGAISRLLIGENDEPSSAAVRFAKDDRLALAQVEITVAAELLSTLNTGAQGEKKRLNDRAFKKMQLALRLIGEADAVNSRLSAPRIEEAPALAAVLEPVSFQGGGRLGTPAATVAAGGPPNWKPYEMGLSLGTLLGSLGVVALLARKDRREAREARLKLRETELKNEELEIKLSETRLLRGARSA